MSNGGRSGGDDLELSWDNKWVAKATQHEGYWIAEAAIPFKTLRYKEGAETWNINVYRIDTRSWGTVHLVAHPKAVSYTYACFHAGIDLG